jgi:23S rRNA pseudouridine1911/1915/1917 synthase
LLKYLLRKVKVVDVQERHSKSCGVCYLSDMQTAQDIKILYEDNHCIAVVKPAGMLVQGDISGDESLMDHLKNFIKHRNAKPGNVFLGLIHRLDRNVEGIVVFGKTSKGASRISEQIRNHTFSKEYHAWVMGSVEPRQGTLIHYIERDAAQNISRALSFPRQGADKAELSYEVVEGRSVGNQSFSLVKIQLKTGRHHQIRAQFAAVHHPLMGDTKYGSPIALADRKIALCATAVGFEKPVPTEGADPRVIISIPVPVFPLEIPKN